MSKEFNLLFLGDVVGRPAREAVKEYLLSSKVKNKFDFKIANLENASHGFGLTKKCHDDFIQWGLDCATSGNHIWDKKEVFTYINDSKVLVRPLNYPKAPGVGYRVFNDKIVVINLMGKTFMPPIECPFATLDKLIKKLKKNYDFKNMISFIDFHAEATAEKICLAKYAASLGVKALVGTHTHVQTADETIMDNLAYISDAGACASVGGVIGMDFENSIKRMTTSLPARFDVYDGDVRQINGVKIVFDYESGIPKKIERINFNIEVKK